jgi:hypothetical protein
MMLYLRIEVTRIFSKVPTGRTGRFFAALDSEAISSGRFDETTTYCLAVNCCDERDANREFRRRDEEIRDRHPNACVSIRSINATEYDYYQSREEVFDDFMHQILGGKVVKS